jgi:A/G-specific adenine glycosylase
VPSFRQAFARKLIDWQRAHGRHDLPWQGMRDPYRIWLAEVMLQQTQVATVIPYYERFLKRFRTVQALARAPEDEVLRLWSGLGYYARGRNLHRAARLIAKHGFPRTAAAIAELPGVGRSTAAAIAVFAYGERAAILDGNAKRVLARTFGLSDEDELWRAAEGALPRRNIETYTQALMDLGASVCTRAPQCGACPVAAGCSARQQGRIAELPAPRKRRELPQREVRWLVLRRNGAVLLERRPAPGIWGGLWCFPELSGRTPAGAKRFAPIEHGFTHFRLRIRPLVWEARNGAPPPVSGGRWLGLEQAKRSAIPAPVKALLRELE